MATTTYVFTQGNTRPYFAIQIKSTLTNLPIDITGATVKFFFREQAARTAAVTNAVATVVDAVNGKVEYHWATTDLNTPGLYNADFRVTFVDTTIQSVLISGVQVLAKLG